MHHLVAGFGEIGQAVHALFEDEANVTISINDPGAGLYIDDVDVVIDILHVCFPYSEKFVGAVQEYIDIYMPKHVIVYSTVPIGTCEKIGTNIVHSPIEGRHPDLELSIRTMERWLGTSNKEEGQFFTSFFESLFMRVKVVGSSKYTEALKLLSTTEYGINIIFSDYKKRIADDLDMPYELTKEWNQDYNKLYKNMGLGDRFQKFVLDPPNGKVGGHCVRENSILLNEQYPDDWVKRIGDYK